MSALINPTIDVYLAVVLTIGVAWLYSIFKKGAETSQGQQRDIKASLFLLAHTLYILYHVLVARPENLFEALKLPVNTAPDTMRALLIQQSDDGSVPGHLELLLKRLGSFDMRILYVRFGHDTIANCEHCVSYEDFALFLLPGTLLSYIREVGAIGMLTLSSSKRGYLRPLGVGALVVACLTELYWIVTSPIQIPQQSNDEATTYMLHDRLLRYRHFLFLILPLIIYKLPSIPIPIPILSNLLSPPIILTPEQKQQHHATTLRTLEHLLPALHLAKYTKATIMRSSELRERAIKWWDEEEKEGRWMLEDESLKRTARVAGLGFGEGPSGTREDDEPLRKSADVAVVSIQIAAAPSEHWT